MNCDYPQLLIDAGRRMLSAGVTIGAWGNISVRDPENCEIYITPSGMAYERLTRQDIVVIGYDGTVLRGSRRPSVETGLHTAVYAARPECMAILHTHPVYSTVFSAAGEDIPIFLDEAAQTLRDTVRSARYAMPGSAELAENCVEALGSRSMACLLRSHGAVCLGSDLEQAFLVSSVLESSARILIMMRSVGLHAEPYSRELLEKMERFMSESYGQK